MAKATGRIPTAKGVGNVRPTGLSEHEAAVALLALLGGAKRVPGIAELRAVVKRAVRLKVITLKGRRRHAA
jgi:hypothetical protein